MIIGIYRCPATGFFVACLNGNVKTVKLLLDDKRVDVNVLSSLQLHAFVAAVKRNTNNHAKIVNLLLETDKKQFAWDYILKQLNNIKDYKLKERIQQKLDRTHNPQKKKIMENQK